MEEQVCEARGSVSEIAQHGKIESRETKDTQREMRRVRERNAMSPASDHSAAWVYNDEHVVAMS